MGNCQAAEAATVVIQHPGGGRVDRIYWSVSASDVMNANPGHYVAMVVVSPLENGTPPAKQLKLLRPGDTLVIGQVYRLVSFEDVLREFAAKKSVKLGKLLERSALSSDKKKNQARTESTSDEQSSSVKLEEQFGSSSSRGVGRHHGQWRPALQSISEL